MTRPTIIVNNMIGLLGCPLVHEALVEETVLLAGNVLGAVG